jgi:hypothetical protein
MASGVSAPAVACRFGSRHLSTSSENWSLLDLKGSKFVLTVPADYPLLVSCRVSNREDNDSGVRNELLQFSPFHLQLHPTI